MKNTKVNLFVIGAMKAGTTAFVDQLSQHPNIYVCPIKEPNYFVDNPPRELYDPSRFFDLNTYFQKEFPKPLHIANVVDSDDYQKLFTLRTNEKYAVDASTFYLHSPGTAERIHDYNSNATIVLLTRNPLERCYSHYRMAVGLAREKRSFEEAMKEELDLFKSGSLPWYSYLHMSFYDHSILRYQGLFENVYTIRFEDLRSDKLEVFNKLSNSLKISPFEYKFQLKQNKTRDLRFPKLFYFLKKLGLKDFFSRAVGHKTKRKLFEAVSIESQTKPDLSAEIEQELLDVFANHSNTY